MPVTPYCVLVGSLGASWAVVPEVYGALATGTLNLYERHPERDSLRKELRGLQPPDAIHLVTTRGERAARSIENLQHWWDALDRPFALRIWQAADTNELATDAECKRLRELTYRVVLAAREGLPEHGQLLLSLAGGRKTMSADLQGAAHYFGCEALLHVTDVGDLDPRLKEASPFLFTQPLPAGLARQVRPMNLGANPRSELLDPEPPIRAKHFTLLGPDSGDVRVWAPDTAEPALFEILEKRSRESQRLLGNFISQLISSDTYPNWRSLYRLPPATLQRLRETPLGLEHRHWLTHLPKADLHRHVGGCLSLAQQRRVAETIWCAAGEHEKAAARSAIGELVRDAAESRDWNWHWPDRLTRGIQIPGNPRHHRAICAAALLLQCPQPFLERQLFGLTEPRVALKNSHEHGFAAYERPGELTGSAVLGHPAAVETYASAVVENARAEGLFYLELRGSPHKYRPEDPVGFLGELRDALQAAGATTADRGDPVASLQGGSRSPLVGFVWILDRRARPGDTGAIVEQASSARDTVGTFLLGLDLAGDETGQRPEDLAVHFLPAFQACLPVTIHAGEGESADNIWQAAYQLHADRIGHGLSLADKPALAQRFRDRGILLELCPTSNREVIGFRDPDILESAQLAPYPLRPLLEMGIPLTLCTDNPGISRTTLADEYIAAARMQSGAGHTELTQWETLAVIRQAFVHAFLPAQLRDPLEKLVDRAILRHLMENETGF